MQSEKKKKKKKKLFGFGLVLIFQKKWFAFGWVSMTNY
jgi:hypothetical protein